MRNTTSIDGIVRATLMTMGLPIHYYVQFMHYALKCLNQELNMDSRPLIKTIELSMDTNNEIAIPRDYIDIVKIGQRLDGKHAVKIYGENPNLARIQTAHNAANTADDTALQALNYGGYFFNNFYNDKGEHKGRMYGYGNDVGGSSYKVVPERNVIKLSNKLSNKTTIYLEYVAYHTATSASYIDPRAAECIEAYIIYKFKEHNRAINRFEVGESKQEYYNQLRKLRGRLLGLTKTDILRLVRGEFRQSVKL